MRNESKDYHEYVSACKFSFCRVPMPFLVLSRYAFVEEVAETKIPSHSSMYSHHCSFILQAVAATRVQIGI